MIFLVSYDLNTPGKNYGALYKVLKSAPAWWHYLESTWVLSANESVQTWSDRIREVIDSNDSFIIVDITSKSRQGWLSEKAWEWLRNHDDQH